MKKEQVTIEFLEDLKYFLAKWEGVEIESSDHFEGYAECGEDIRTIVTIDRQWDENGDTIREYTEIDLGSLVTGEIIQKKIDEHKAKKLLGEKSD